ncbi:class E sortase [Klenkia sp. LSe6-5]|uniref:Class E sortase n=1 Tax=Klenkia sesuvii TaxID=3103137 RepID=A0ABU8DS41_9ACTN
MDDAGTGGRRRGRHAPEEPAAAELPPPDGDATVWTDRVPAVPPLDGTADGTTYDTTDDAAAGTADDDEPAARPARTRGDLVRTGIRGVGQLLVTAGLVVLLFVVYEVWVTDLTSDRKQDALSSELREDWAGGDPTVPTLPGGGLSEVPLGEGFAFIRIPRFGADYVKVVLEGTDEDELVEGPGHYVDSAMPGEQGNFALAGHRVGKGSPFLDLDQLRAGDPIVIETETDWYVYRVLGGDDPNGIPGQQIVLPTDVSVIAPTPNGPLDGPASGAYLTLTTCHPKFSARERLIVHAVLDGDPVPKADAPQGPPALSEG